MISVTLSIGQLIEAIQNLNETEKIQIQAALNDAELSLTEEQKQEILHRETEYKSGRMKTFTMDEVKASFDFLD